MRRAAFALFFAMLLASCTSQPQVKLKGQRFTVEIAENDASRARGMMFRDQLAKDAGMLFIFDDEAPRSFWMHNCKIALDILYFDASFKMVGRALSVPPCNLPPERCPSYASGAPAKYVLELNAGRSTEIGADLGDVLEFKR